jgi:hypothetical protein
MEAVIVYFLRQNTQEENHEFIFKLFHEIQYFFWDSSSFVRNRAAVVVSHVVSEAFLDDDKIDVVGDRGKRRFSTDFYAYNFVGKFALLLTDSLVSVRKNAVITIAEILNRNPYGADLDLNNLIAKYQEIVRKRETMGDETDEVEDVILSKLTERYNRIKPIITEYIEEYFELEDFPEVKDDVDEKEKQSEELIRFAHEYYATEASVVELTPCWLGSWSFIWLDLPQSG